MMAAPWQIERDDHASDAELVRLLDECCEPDERAPVEAHAADCAECAGRLARLRGRSARLTLVLVDGDDNAELDRRAARVAAGFGAAPSASARRASMPGWLRAAAVVVGLLALGSAVRPVRAWIAARWTALTAHEVVAVHPVPQALMPTPAPASATSVAFVPGAASFVVAFEAVPAGGRLSVEPTATDRLTLTSTGRAGVLVLPGELRVQNSAASTSDYRVEMPAGLTRLRVRVGGRTVLDVAPSAATHGWTIDLVRGGSPGH